MTYISRIAESRLKRISESGKIAIILGARQVGKTTLAEHVLKGQQAVFLNFDIETDKQRFLAASHLPPDDAVKSFGNPQFIVIDEAQRIPETGRIVKGWYDSRIKSEIILLGSSSLNLMNQSAESLTGRNEKIFLFPLFFREIIRSQTWYSDVFSDEQILQHFYEPVQSLLMQSLVFGNYPEVVLTADKTKFLLNLVSDYLLKDVLQLGLVKNPDLIKKMLMLLAYQTGSEVSVNEIASNLGMSRQTVERYFDLLEQTFVIFRLPAFSTNPRKEIHKTSKVFFWDTGIRNAVLNEFSLNPLRADIGSLWENFIILEMLKTNSNNNGKAELSFWRTYKGAEIDLVAVTSKEIIGYEIKSNNKAPQKPLNWTHGDYKIINKDNYLKYIVRK
jgi:predicted AAA+ superfamily ATPase